MKKHLLPAALVCSTFSFFWSANAFSVGCTFDWQSTDLETALVGPKDYYGDTNIAYAIFSFPTDPSTVYRIKGSFPHARYMSLESSELIDIGSWDFDAIQDHEIVPDDGSKNPFTPEVALDAEPRNFTVDAVPDGAEWVAVNRLDVPVNGNKNDIWLRIVAPNQQIADGDLPTIEAYDLATGEPKECQQASVVSLPLSVDSSEKLDFGVALYANESPALSQDFIDYESLDPVDVLAGILTMAVPEKWWTFSFRVIDIPFEGSSAIPGYSYGLTKMGAGKVALVKFKAPSFVDTTAGTGPFDPNADLRYWSLCALDLGRGEGLACQPDYLAKTKNGFVTIVYGPEGAVETKAEQLGYNFLPDEREDLGIDVDGLPLALVYRQMLPSAGFSATNLNKGSYVPRARICSAQSFLMGYCQIW